MKRNQADHVRFGFSKHPYHNSQRCIRLNLLGRICWDPSSNSNFAGDERNGDSRVSLVCCLLLLLARAVVVVGSGGPRGCCWLSMEVRWLLLVAAGRSCWLLLARLLVDARQSCWLLLRQAAGRKRRKSDGREEEERWRGEDSSLSGWFCRWLLSASPALSEKRRRAEAALVWEERKRWIKMF